MNTGSKIRTLCWLTLLFTSGAVIGNVMTPVRPLSREWWQTRTSTPALPAETLWIRHRFANISERFDLTPEQQAALRPAFKETELELREVRLNATRETRRIVVENNQAIRAVMTPDQVISFEEWRKQFLPQNQTAPATAP